MVLGLWKFNLMRFMVYISEYDRLFLGKISNIVESRLADDNFRVTELASEAGFSRFILSRKLNSLTGKSAKQFIREARLKKALEILQNEPVSAAEVAFRVGFNSPAYFNTCFHEFHGFPPGKSRNEPRGSVDLKKTKITLKSIPVITVVLLITATVFIILLKKGRSLNSGYLPKLTVAVMPFQDLTNDTNLAYLNGFLLDNILHELVLNKQNLNIKSGSSANQIWENQAYMEVLRILPSKGKKDIDFVITGSLNKLKDMVFLNASIYDQAGGNILRNFPEKISPGQDADSIIKNFSKKIADYLLITKYRDDFGVSPEATAQTEDPAAFWYYRKGLNSFNNRDYPSALEMYVLAYERDTSFYPAGLAIARTYTNLLNNEKAREKCLEMYQRRDRMSPAQRFAAEALYSELFETPVEVIRNINKLISLNDKNASAFYNLGINHIYLYNFEQGSEAIEHSIRLYAEIGQKPPWINNYFFLAIAYNRRGMFGELKKVVRLSERDFPGTPRLHFLKGLLALREERFEEAEVFIEEYRSALTRNDPRPSEIYNSIAMLYYEAEIYEKALDYFRKALVADPDDPQNTYCVVSCLIDKEIDVNEGMALTAKALQRWPNEFGLHDAWGWGLYKAGRFSEAMTHLRKSDSLKPKFDPDLYQHMIKVKEALQVQL